jgi:hypothetical protein
MPAATAADEGLTSRAVVAVAGSAAETLVELALPSLSRLMASRLPMKDNH